MDLPKESEELITHDKNEEIEELHTDDKKEGSEASSSDDKRKSFKTWIYSGFITCISYGRSKICSFIAWIYSGFLTCISYGRSKIYKKCNTEENSNDESVSEDSQTNKNEKCNTEENSNVKVSSDEVVSEDSQTNKNEKCNTEENSNVKVSSDEVVSEDSRTNKNENQNFPKSKMVHDKSKISKKKIGNNQNYSKEKTANVQIEEQFDKPPSLMNIGANCYLNSALQGISSCDIFLKELADLHKKYDNLEKLSLFHKLIDILNGGKSNRLEISRNPIFRNWNKSGQQDSFELLAYVMNQVYTDIRKDLENNGKIPKRDMQEWLKEELPMRIIIKYEIRCSCNNVVEVPLQSDLALHVAISSNKSSDLQSLVEEFFKEDIIEDYECDKDDCDGKGAKKYILLCQPLPKTLCIHLQRTFWNGWEMKKIEDYIQFPKQLKINSKFTVLNDNNTQNEVVKQEEKIISDNLVKSEISVDDRSQQMIISHSLNENYFQQKPMNIEKSFESQLKISNDNSYIYENYNLTSVIVHYGSVYGGHYVCYKKLNDKWFLTNDSLIRQATEDEVLNCQAYILFYEKSSRFEV